MWVSSLVVFSSMTCWAFCTAAPPWAIQAGARREFATTYAIYKRAVGEGTVAELFEVSPEEEEADAALMAAQGGAAVQNAQHVMEENTTKLDTHTPGRLHCC